ncbi:hypothetical protein M405DRAFT_833284 [Rhizopogon salebrosus TDB-379]|nr:hypothetical protein M405DRAFT_833284 [Rhizopogon salebrosus TDB-379]
MAVVSDASQLLSLLEEPRIKSAVEGFEKTRNESLKRQKDQLSAYDDDALINRTFTPWRSPDSKYTILVWQDTGQEVVFNVQGILTQCMLPPLSDRFAARQRPLQLRQSVSIVGATEGFFAASSALRRLYSFLELRFGERQMRPWNLSNVGSRQAIMAQSRYVSPRSELFLWGDALPQLRENPKYDPYGVIAKWVNEGEFAFTEDNLVRYSEIITQGGRSRRVETDPSIFRPGQIVEVGLTVGAVKTRDVPLQFSFLVHMDSLLLLSRLPAMIVAEEKAVTASETNEVTAPLPKKRRVEENDMLEFDEICATHQFSSLVVSGKSYMDDSE